MRHNDSTGADQHTRDAREIEKLRTQVAILQADLAVAKALLTAYAEDLEAALKRQPCGDDLATRLAAAERERDQAREALRESCREWVEDKFDACKAPAAFLLWGKLFPSEALGPRCYDHAAKHIGWSGMSRIDQYAVLDLRAALSGPAPAPEGERYDGDWTIPGADDLAPAPEADQ